jgi:hypothetical protein
MLPHRIDFDVWRNLYVSTLLGGEFANCHGQGPTPEGAYISLLLTVRAKRRQNAKVQS